MVSKNRSNKAHLLSANYQDSVAISLSEEANDDAAAQQGDDEQNESGLAPSATESILPAVDKVCYLSSSLSSWTDNLIASKNCSCHVIKPTTQSLLASIRRISEKKS